MNGRRRGELRIYLGAAPGVGKTYAMLAEAHRRISAAGFRPRIVQEITDPFMILTLVAAGVGVALVPAGVADVMPSGALFVPLRGEPTYLLNALAWSAENPSTVLAAVLAVVAWFALLSSGMARNFLARLGEEGRALSPEWMA